MQLLVIFHDQRCGLLSIDDAQRMSFHYFPDYVASGGPAISVSIPVGPTTFQDPVTFPFFENLLPEGHIRDLIADRLGTANNNFARLLDRTGGDVAGAISLMPADATNAHAPPQHPVALDAAELGRIIEQIKTDPFLANDSRGMRLSLAGAQNKLPVIVDSAGQICLPGSQPSTHILKPPSDRFPALVENELLCMCAAHKAGLRVPETRLHSFVTAEGIERDCYLIKRYDRYATDAGEIRRLHQEDLCQVTATVSAKKYTQDGGPDFADLFQAVRQHTRPAALYQNELVRRMLFNLLIGNQDAHGKNFSFVHTRAGITLAPAYDLVCTLVYPELSDRFAMPIGTASRIEELDTDALDLFQQHTGINLKRQASVLRRFIATALDCLLTEAQRVKEESFADTHPVLDRITQLAQRHGDMLQRWLGK